MKHSIIAWSISTVAHLAVLGLFAALVFVEGSQGREVHRGNTPASSRPATSPSTRPNLAGQAIKQLAALDKAIQEKENEAKRLEQQASVAQQQQSDLPKKDVGGGDPQPVTKKAGAGENQMPVKNAGTAPENKQPGAEPSAANSSSGGVGPIDYASSGPKLASEQDKPAANGSHVFRTSGADQKKARGDRDRTGLEAPEYQILNPEAEVMALFQGRRPFLAVILTDSKGMMYRYSPAHGMFLEAWPNEEFNIKEYSERQLALSPALKAQMDRALVMMGQITVAKIRVGVRNDMDQVILRAQAGAAQQLNLRLCDLTDSGVRLNHEPVEQRVAAAIEWVVDKAGKYCEIIGSKQAGS